MSKKIKADELYATISAELGNYSKGVTDIVKKAVDDEAKDCRDNIKADSPVKTGRYKKGWRTKTEIDNAFFKTVRVYNSAKPGLTHLLEKGHARKGGGRTRAFPHIQKNEEKAKQNLPKRIEEAISRGT